MAEVLLFVVVSFPICFLGGLGTGKLPPCAAGQELAVHSKTGSGTAELIPVWMPVWTICFISLSAISCSLLALNDLMGSAEKKTLDDWPWDYTLEVGLLQRF